MTSIGTVFQRVEELCERLGIILLSILCILAALQIAFRFTGGFIDISAAWTEELSRYLFVMMILVGVPYTMRSGDSISIRPLLRRLSARRQRLLLSVSNLFVVVLSLIMVYSAYIISQRTLGSTLATIDWLRVGYAHVVLAAAFMITALFAIEETVHLWRTDASSAVASDPEPEGPVAKGETIKSDGGEQNE